MVPFGVFICLYGKSKNGVVIPTPPRGFRFGMVCGVCCGARKSVLCIPHTQATQRIKCKHTSLRIYQTYSNHSTGWDDFKQARNTKYSVGWEDFKLARNTMYSVRWDDFKLARNTKYSVGWDDFKKARKYHVLSGVGGFQTG